MFAEVCFQTDQGNFVLKGVKFPEGTKVKDLENGIIDSLADKLVLCNPELVFNLEEGTADAKLIIDDNSPIEISIEHDYKTKEEVETNIRNGEVLKIVYKELVDYLLDCNFKINVLPK